MLQLHPYLIGQTSQSRDFSIRSVNWASWIRSRISSWMPLHYVLLTKMENWSRQVDDIFCGIRAYFNLIIDVYNLSGTYLLGCGSTNKEIENAC